MMKSGEECNTTDILYFSRGKVILYRSLFWIGIILFLFAAVVGDDMYSWFAATERSHFLYALNWPFVLLISGPLISIFSFLAYRKQFGCKAFCCKGILHYASAKIYSLKMEFDEEYCPCCGQRYRVLFEKEQALRRVGESLSKG